MKKIILLSLLTLSLAWPFGPHSLTAQQQPTYSTAVVDGKAVIVETVQSAITQEELQTKIDLEDAVQQKLLAELKVSMDKKAFLTELLEGAKKATPAPVASKGAEAAKETPAPKGGG